MSEPVREPSDAETRLALLCALATAAGAWLLDEEDEEALDGLFDRGLIRHQRDPADSFRYYAELTEEGAEFIRAAARGVVPTAPAELDEPSAQEWKAESYRLRTIIGEATRRDPETCRRWLLDERCALAEAAQDLYDAARKEASGGE